MTKVIMNGCNGHMGHVISDLCEKDSEIEIVAGIDINTQEKASYNTAGHRSRVERPINNRIKHTRYTIDI